MIRTMKMQLNQYLPLWVVNVIFSLCSFTIETYQEPKSVSSIEKISASFNESMHSLILG